MANYSSSGRGRSSGGMGMVAVGTVALLAVAGAGGAWYYFKHKGAAPTPPSMNANAPIEAQPAAQPAKDGIKAPEAIRPSEVAAPTAGPVIPVPPAAAPVAPTAGPAVCPPATGTPYVPVAAPAALTPQTGHVQQEIAQGIALIEGGKVVEGRAILSEVLFNYDKELKPENAAWIRAKLTELNNTYVYGKRNLSEDDIAAVYTVKPGDLVAKIANAYRIPDQLLLNLSGMKSAKSLQVGNKVKVILGPVHARVTKHEYRMDFYVLNKQGAKIYLKSLNVGLGMDNRTPVGKFRVGVLDGDLLRGKMENSAWKDPENGKYYEPGDKANPIGRFWIPLQGTEPTTAGFTGYGIHGTTDPKSIGQNMSHGCVRLVDADIEEVYHTLFCGKRVFSTLEILP